MAETWYAVYRKDTGKLIATGTKLGKNIPAEYGILTLDYNPQQGYVWNEQTRDFEVAPEESLIRSNLEQLEDLTPLELDEVFKAAGLTFVRRKELRDGPAT